MITIVQSLKKINPAFNPVIIGVQSTEQARAGFQFVAKIKDAAGNLLSTKKLIGNTTGAPVKIDVSNIVGNVQDFNFWRGSVKGGEYIYYYPAFRQGFLVEIYESYDDTLKESVTVSGVYTIPAALPSIKFAFYDYDNIKAGKWLTNFERLRLRNTDSLTASYLCPVGGVASFEYSFFDLYGALLQTVTKANPKSAIAEDVIHVHCGLSDLKAFTGISDAVYSNASTYQIKPTGGAALSFTVVSEDCRFNGVMVHFLNEWGAVDSFLFNLATRRSVTIEKKSARLTFDGNDLRPETFASNTPYVVKFTDGLKITSDFITDNDSNALLEMFTSPIVSIETEKSIFLPAAKGQKLILPCDIALSSYDIKQSNLEKLFNIELDLKISVDNTRQSL